MNSRKGDAMRRKGALTDAKVLEAAVGLSGRRLVTTGDLARAAGLSPQTTSKSVKRLKALGRWSYPFPHPAPRRAQRKAAYRHAKTPTFRPTAGSCYALMEDHWNRPHDLGDVAKASREALAMHRAAVAAGRRRGLAS